MPQRLLRIRPLGEDIVIAADTATLPGVERLLSPWAPAQVDGCEAQLHVVAAAGADGRREYVVHDGEASLLAATDAETVWVAVQNWVDGEVARRACGLAPVHAGVVVWQGRAILLPGTSGAGKTTLTRALVARGASYFSDELAFIDAHGRVHAYPRHMVIRDAHGIGRSTPVRAAPSHTDPVPVGAILGLTFSAAALELERIPASEGVMLLLANTAHRIGEAGVPVAFVRAAAAARCYRGARGDADAASERILAVVDAQAL